MTTRKLTLGLFAACSLQLGAVSVAQAGGPLFNCADGVPFVWPGGGADIEVNLDQGGLGALSNAEADAFILAALQTWTDVDTATISSQTINSLMLNWLILNTMVRAMSKVSKRRQWYPFA